MWAGSSPAALAFSSAAEVRLVNLNFTFQFARLQFRHMVERFAQALVDAGHRLVVHPQIGGHAVRRLLLVEAGQDGNLTPQLLQGLLFSTTYFAAFYVPSLRLTHLKRTAENALSTPQKVGRTVENVLFLHNLASF